MQIFKHPLVPLIISAIVGGFVALGLISLPTLLETPEARLREKISIDARDDAYLYNGADLIVYSDNHSTKKFSVDGATGNTIITGTLASGSFAPSGNITVTGALSVSQGASIANGLTVAAGTAALPTTTTGNITATGTLSVSQGASIANGLTVAAGTAALPTTTTGNITATGTLSVSQSAAIANGLTVAAGTISLPTGSIGIAAVADITRTVTLYLGGFQNLTASTAITFTDAVNANPNFGLVNGSLAIVYDATGGSVDTDLVGTSFSVPTDYASSGYFIVTATQGGATVTNIESISCTVGINGAAQGSAGVTNLANQTAWQSVTVVPAGTYAAGKSVGLNCKQGNSAADDTVNILSIQFDYLATQ